MQAASDARAAAQEQLQKELLAQSRPSETVAISKVVESMMSFPYLHLTANF